MLEEKKLPDTDSKEHKADDELTDAPQVSEKSQKGTDNSRFQMISYKNKYTIEQWYEALKEHTFETLTMELTLREAEAIRSFYIQYSENNAQQKQPESDADVFRSLEERMDQLIEQFTKNGDSVFVKLSTRSPKDTFMESPKLKELLVESFLEFEEANPEEKLDPNHELTCYLNCMIQSMSLTSAAEALDFIAKSERVYVDLGRWLEFPEELPPVSIIFRKFCSDLPASMEFRGFVHGNELNALSQYYDVCYFSDLVEKKEQISQLIQRYFTDAISPLLRDIVEDYVIDFVIVNGDVLVIELNPWAATTGGALFKWQSDRNVLMNGPFEFRVVEEPEADIQQYIFKDIRDLISTAKKEARDRQRSADRCCCVQ